MTLKKTELRTCFWKEAKRLFVTLEIYDRTAFATRIFKNVFYIVTVHKTLTLIYKRPWKFSKNTFFLYVTKKRIAIPYQFSKKLENTCRNAIINGEMLFLTYFRFFCTRNCLLYIEKPINNIPIKNIFLDLKKRIKENNNEP